MWKCKEPRITKAILKKKKKFEEFYLISGFSIKLHNQDSVISVGTDVQIIRTGEGPEGDPHIHDC